MVLAAACRGGEALTREHDIGDQRAPAKQPGDRGGDLGFRVSLALADKQGERAEVEKRPSRAEGGEADRSVVTPLGTSGTWLPDQFTYADRAGANLTAAALAQIPAGPAGTSGVNKASLWSDGRNWTLPALASFLDAPDNRHAAAAELNLGGVGGGRTQTG